MENEFSKELLKLIDLYRYNGVSYAEISKRLALYAYLTACWLTDIEKYGNKSREEIEQEKLKRSKALDDLVEESQKLNLE